MGAYRPPKLLLISALSVKCIQIIFVTLGEISEKDLGIMRFDCPASCFRADGLFCCVSLFPSLPVNIFVIIHAL